MGFKRGFPRGSEGLSGESSSGRAAANPAGESVGGPVRPSLTPEDAAVLLLGYLPPPTQELIREVATERGAPIWHCLLGYAMRCAEQGNLFAPSILALWESGMRAGDPRPCTGCQELFTSELPDARWCCNPCHFDKLETLGHAEGCAVLAYRERVNAVSG